jgi:hypothetical protein
LRPTQAKDSQDSISTEKRLGMAVYAYIPATAGSLKYENSELG